MQIQISARDQGGMREEGWKGWGKRDQVGGGGERETLEEHWPQVACQETSGWYPVCSKEATYAELYEHFKGLSKVI